MGPKRRGQIDLVSFKTWTNKIIGRLEESNFFAKGSCSLESIAKNPFSIS